MTITNSPLDLTDYPEADGKPMTESDATRDYLIYCVEVLRIFFQSRRNVYVSGNLCIYYRQGDPKAVVSPDVFVVFGVPKHKRRSYQVWKEGGKLPSFVLEITSRTTRREDEVEKPKLYAQLGVQEYFQYDPTGDYLNPQLKGFRLVEGTYQAISPQTINNDLLSIHSQTLGLDLQLQETPDTDITETSRSARPMRFYDPQTGETLLDYQELEDARQQAEQARLAETQARLEAEQARLDAIPRLLEMGLTVEQVAEALALPVEDVRQTHPNP